MGIGAYRLPHAPIKRRIAIPVGGACLRGLGALGEEALEAREVMGRAAQELAAEADLCALAAGRALGPPPRHARDRLEAAAVRQLHLEQEAPSRYQRLARAHPRPAAREVGAALLTDAEEGATRVRVDLRIDRREADRRAPLDPSVAAPVARPGVRPGPPPRGRTRPPGPRPDARAPA